MSWRPWTMVVVVAMLVGGPAHGLAMAHDAAGADLTAVSRGDDDCSFLIRFDVDPRPQLGDIACGSLDVPENWSNPAGRRLQIRYVVLKSLSATPAPDPVIYLEGGPGGSALTGVESRAEIFAKLRETRDVVLFDQRGTRLSSPLRCEALSFDAVFQSDEGPAEAEATPTVGTTPATGSMDPYEIMQRARQAQAPRAAECAREITSHGVDLRQYNSIASANDTVALIKALGYDEYNLYGISYGTRLALVIMRDHPESGIRSVVLDSTFPPEINGFEKYPEEPHEVVIQLFADCALDRACNAAYPNLKARFIALLAKLREQPVIAPDGTSVDDRDVVALMQQLATNIRAVPYVPLMIDDLERGQADVYLGLISGSLFEAAPVTEAPTGADVNEALADAAVAAQAIDPTTAIDASPARLFFTSLQAEMEGLPEDDAGRLLSLLLNLEKQSPSREAIEEFIAQAFPDESQAQVRERLAGVLVSLTDQDVREVFEILAQTVTLFDFLKVGSSQPQFNSVECNEEVPFQSLDNTAKIAQGLEIPQMAQGIVEAMADQFAICEVWPSGRAPAMENLPVTSEAPTLIFAGAYDLQTPVSWNKSAFVTLPNGTFVEFPMTGHGAITFWPCASAIAAAFIDDPVAPLDTSCTNELRPQWVLPSVSSTGLKATPAAA
jgi:pimeloyl-ACP methyl ester carboxylesterase